MKVILKQDVAKIGKKHSTVEVPNGYAFNNLIPHGKAVPATKENLKNVAQIKQRAQTDEQANIETAQAIKEKFADQPLQIAMELNEKGQMFQALTATHVNEAASEQGADIPVSMIDIPETIKEAGTFTVILKAGGEEFPIEVNVVAK